MLKARHGKKARSGNGGGGRTTSPSSVLLLGTRGIKARHRHLLRDLLRLLPHARPGTKLDTEEHGLRAVVSACEDADCDSALLLDARDPSRLYMWAAGCPDGPSAMLRVRNVHTVAELNLEARRMAGVRNLLVFDKAFNVSAERRVLKALLTLTLSVPLGAVQSQMVSCKGQAGSSSIDLDDVEGDGDEFNHGFDREEDERDDTDERVNGHSGAVERIKHTLSFSWVDNRIWMRVYRISHINGSLEVEEIGPRMVLEPVRIIASGFGGAILHTNEARHRGEDSEVE